MIRKMRLTKQQKIDNIILYMLHNPDKKFTLVSSNSKEAAKFMGDVRDRLKKLSDALGFSIEKIVKNLNGLTDSPEDDQHKPS